MVESRLLWEATENKFELTVAEFLCSREGKTVQVHLSSEPSKVVSKPVEQNKSRRWVVEKVYLRNEGSVTVEKWWIDSSVTYTCTEGTLAFHFLFSFIFTS